MTFALFFDMTGENMHNQNVQNLNINDITSDVYTIAPTQCQHIATLIGDMVADNMNMRTFAPKIRAIAMQALQTALKSARHMGENK